ncbi:MAG: family 10 glycosylhydrolase [candidate division WS1 bacterium]|nr:family 10 glycosylhydrolase [candidate division WS1 bacterium]
MLRVSLSVAIVLFSLMKADAQIVSPLEADDHTLLLYRFEGNGPIIGDEGPLGLHGTVVESEEGALVRMPEHPEGVAGNALTLEERQALVVPRTPEELRGMDELTVEVWFCTTNEAPAHRQRIVLYWEHYLISIFEGGKLMGHLYNEDGEKYILRGHTAIHPGIWYHAALTYDGQRAKLWLNGREEASVRMTGSISAAPGTGLQIGAIGDDWFEGDIDELRISNVARTAFPGARQYDFCRPSESLLISGGDARMIFDPVVPEGVSSVTCSASLGEATSGEAQIGADALQPLDDSFRAGHCGIVLDVPEDAAGEMVLSGTVRYQQEGQEQSATREFAVIVEQMISPPAVEFRGAWTHSHKIEDPEDIFSRMAASGLNAAVMRVRRGETAYYRSTLGPISEVPFENENLIEQCAEAANRHGIDLHCYVNNFPVGSPNSEYAQQMREEGRWQKTATGADAPWLCPSHPANLELVEQAMVELVRDYDIAGVQYDFIRYGQEDVCFCDRCRANFEARLGHAVENWPTACLEGGELHEEWLDQRADLITEAVRRTSAAIRATDPGVVISAAVFAMPPKDAKMKVGQEWDLWCREGLLDALCPMSYMADNVAYERTVALILSAVGEYVPVYAGIGLRSGNQVMRYPEELAAKINIARRLGAPGFTMFCVTPPTDAPETVIIPVRESMLPGAGRPE